MPKVDHYRLRDSRAEVAASIPLNELNRETLFHGIESEQRRGIPELPQDCYTLLYRLLHNTLHSDNFHQGASIQCIQKQGGFSHLVLCFVIYLAIRLVEAACFPHLIVWPCLVLGKTSQKNFLQQLQYHKNVCILHKCLMVFALIFYQNGLEMVDDKGGNIMVLEYTKENHYSFHTSEIGH